MLDFYYSVNQFNIKLTIPEEINLYNLKAHIPEIQKGANPSSPLVVLEFRDNDDFWLYQDNHKVILYGKWTSALKNDIPHLVYGALRKCCIELGYYPVHSVLIENSLFVGHSGTGKTSIALAAIASNMKVYSHNRSLVYFKENNLRIWAGTDIISIRPNLYKENKFLKDAIKEGDRIYCETKDPLDVPSIKTIKSIYLHNVTDQPLTIEELSSDSALHECYPYFMDTIKTDVVVGRGKGLFNGETSLSSKKRLMKNLTDWTSANRVFKISGSIDDIVNTLKNSI